MTRRPKIPFLTAVFKAISWSAALLVFLNPANARTWINSDGRTIEAEFIELKDSKVGLLMTGKRYDVPLDSLSEEDQSYAKSESQRRIEKANAEARQFMGQELKPGELLIFTFSLSDENQKLAQRGGTGWGDSFASSYSGSWIKDMSKGHKLDEIRVLLGIPYDFDPKRGCPIFVQWTTGDIKSNVQGAKGYWNDCRDKGWMLVSVEGSPDPKSTWSNAVFYAAIKEFFEQLHLKYEGSEKWPVATGGFSGGAKTSQWMGGIMSELDGVDLKGYWIGGCNEALFDFAIKDMSVSKNAYRNKKAFISSGDADKLVTDRYREGVEQGAEAVRLDVRSKIYSGGHSFNSAHFREALDWFLE
jgi:hypothetical protein